MIMRQTISNTTYLRLLRVMSRRDIIGDVQIIMIRLTTLLGKRLIITLMVTIIKSRTRFVLTGTFLRPRDGNNLTTTKTTYGTGSRVVRENPSYVVLPL